MSLWAIGFNFKNVCLFLGEEPVVVFARRACHLLTVGIICLRWRIELTFISSEGDELGWQPTAAIGSDRSWRHNVSSSSGAPREDREWPLRM